MYFNLNLFILKSAILNYPINPVQLTSLSPCSIFLFMFSINYKRKHTCHKFWFNFALIAIIYSPCPPLVKNGVLLMAMGTVPCLLWKWCTWWVVLRLDDTRAVSETLVSVRRPRDIRVQTQWPNLAMTPRGLPDAPLGASQKGKHKPLVSKISMSCWPPMPVSYSPFNSLVGKNYSSVWKEDEGYYICGLQPPPASIDPQQHPD